MSDSPITELREFLDLYMSTYMETQTHPSVIAECSVMNKARELREKWAPLARAAA